MHPEKDKNNKGGNPVWKELTTPLEVVTTVVKPSEM